MGLCTYACRFLLWFQALNWLHQQAQSICTGQEIFIDHAMQVMELWGIKHQTQVRKLPLTKSQTWTPAKSAGLCGHVGDHSIIKASRTQANNVAPVSPFSTQAP